MATQTGTPSPARLAANRRNAVAGERHVALDQHGHGAKIRAVSAGWHRDLIAIFRPGNRQKDCT
jgi:hypothetical protein